MVKLTTQVSLSSTDGTTRVIQPSFEANKRLLGVQFLLYWSIAAWSVGELIATNSPPPVSSDLGHGLESSDTRYRKVPEQARSHSPRKSAKPF
jgi:hypothetical protein